MRYLGCLSATILLLTLSTGCQVFQGGKVSYTTDRMTLSPRFHEHCPANLMILPVEGEDSLDWEGKSLLRDISYEKLMQKGYAPLSQTFVDKTLRDLGRFHTPRCLDQAWNPEPFKEILTPYCDGVVMISIERYLESGQPSRSGIVIWGKAAVFDAQSMELLYENYIRPTLHPTDPGTGRDRYIRKALEEFVDLLFGGLPPKEGRRI